jgi:alkylhydroperoxidase family enzyme
LIPADTDAPLVGALFKRLQAAGVPIPDLYRGLGNAPELLAGWTRLAWPLRAAASTPRGLRELLILRVAWLTDSDYIWVHHTPMALENGVDASRLDDLGDWAASREFDQNTRAALRLTDELVTTGTVRASVFDAAAASTTDEGIVEIVLTVAFYCCVSRVLHALDIDPEPDV